MIAQDERVGRNSGAIVRQGDSLQDVSGRIAELLRPFRNNCGMRKRQRRHSIVNRMNNQTPAESARQLAELVDRHGPALVLYARQICDEPEDVVQEGFLEFMEQPARPDNVAAWLFRVVRNRALDRIRSSQRRKSRHLKVAGGEQWLTVNFDSQLDAVTVTDSLKELDADLREIITARIWGELSFEQIGDLLNTSSSTAHRRYVEGLELLREKLGATCPKQ
jgi:RNA polymerase sigma factor (sigma-70 family)